MRVYYTVSCVDKIALDKDPHPLWLNKNLEFAGASLWTHKSHIQNIAKFDCLKIAYRVGQLTARMLPQHQMLRVCVQRVEQEQITYVGIATTMCVLTPQVGDLGISVIEFKAHYKSLMTEEIKAGGIFTVNHKETIE